MLKSSPQKIIISTPLEAASVDGTKKNKANVDMSEMSEIWL